MRWHSDQIWSVHKELQCASSEQPLFVRGSEACQLVSTRNCSLILPSVAANIWLTGNEPCPIRQVPPLTPFHCIVPKLVFVCLATLITFFFSLHFFATSRETDENNAADFWLNQLNAKVRKNWSHPFKRKWSGFFLFFCCFFYIFVIIYDSTPPLRPPKKWKWKFDQKPLAMATSRARFAKDSHTLFALNAGENENQRGHNAATLHIIL